ncbi:MAG: mechanosensitive ion channel domain-containing protein [Paludibacter sp.]
MLEQTFYGNTIHEWIISILIILGAFVLNKIIVLLNKHVIHKITSKTKNRLDDILFTMLQAPALLGVALAAIWIATSRLIFDKSLDMFLFKAYQILIVINITWFAVRLVNALIEEYIAPIANDPNNKRIDNNFLPIIRRSLLGIIWAIGLVMALNNGGVNVGTLIASLGIGGLAFALAAQDTIKNIFGGITIFSDRPFRIGDRIKVDGFDGIVEDIGIRSTRLRTLERCLVTIPNYKIVEASVENISEEPMRRILSKIGLTYDTTPEKMNQAIDILKTMPLKIKEIDSEVYVFFSDFANFSMVVTFIYFIQKKSDIPETISKVNLEILTAFNAAGLNFAFPTQTLYLKADDKLPFNIVPTKE